MDVSAKGGLSQFLELLPSFIAFQTLVSLLIENGEAEKDHGKKFQTKLAASCRGIVDCGVYSKR